MANEYANREKSTRSKGTKKEGKTKGRKCGYETNKKRVQTFRKAERIVFPKSGLTIYLQYKLIRLKPLFDQKGTFSEHFVGLSTPSLLVHTSRAVVTQVSFFSFFSGELCRDSKLGALHGKLGKYPQKNRRPASLSFSAELFTSV